MQEREVIFSDDVLAAVDVVFAFKLKSSLLIGSGTAKKAQNYKTRKKLFPGNAKRVTYRDLRQRESLLFQLQKTIKMSLISLINFWFVASGVKM